MLFAVVYCAINGSYLLLGWIFERVGEDVRYFYSGFFCFCGGRVVLGSILEI